MRCALTYMNASSRQNLSGVLMRDVSLVGNWARYERCTRGCHGRGAVCRTNATCTCGVSDPPRAASGAKSGGERWGSLTPRMLHPVLPTVAPTPTRAAQSAAPGNAPKPLIRKDIDQSICILAMSTQPRVSGEPRVEQGEHCSRVCVPPVLSSIEVKQSGNQGVRRGPPERRGLRLRGPVRILQRQHPYASADRLAQLDSEVVHHVAAHMRVREAGLQEPPDIGPVMRNNIVPDGISRRRAFSYATESSGRTAPTIRRPP